MDFLQKSRTVFEYLRDGIERGLLCPREVKDENNNFWMSVKVAENVNLINDKKQKVDVEKDNYIIFDEDKAKCITGQYFNEHYKEKNKNDYYQIVRALTVLHSNKKPIDVYKNAEDNKIEHSNKMFIFEKLNEKYKKGHMSPQERIDYQKIVKDGKDGQNIDFASVSDYMASRISEKLQRKGVRFVSLTTMMELSVNGSTELDIDAIIKNDKDNILVALRDDWPVISELIELEQNFEISDKIHNIDAMSIEELLSFKSQLDSLGVGSGGMRSVDVVERIKEQIKQEVMEKDEVYGKDARNDYEDIVL